MPAQYPSVVRNATRSGMSFAPVQVGHKACVSVAQAQMLPKLTDAQKRVLRWLGKGWSAQPAGGAAWTVNGKRICNTDTLAALLRAGLVEQDACRCWQATEAGRDVTAQLGL